jgi:sulfur-oxidizing protein SoxX
MNRDSTFCIPLNSLVLAVLVMLLPASNHSLAEADAAAIEEGRQVAADRQRGNCYSCHNAEGAELAGNVAPPLMLMKQRFPDRAVLYEQIADPRIRNPNTVMPPYGAHAILTEHELNRVVDYVLSL